MFQEKIFTQNESKIVYLFTKNIHDFKYFSMVIKFNNILIIIQNEQKSK